VLSGLILAVVAGWRFTPPPRALAAPESGGITATLQSDRAIGHLVLSRGLGADFDATLLLEISAGTPLEAREVTFAFTPPLADIEPLRRDAEHRDDGTWQAQGIFLPV